MLTASAVVIALQLAAPISTTGTCSAVDQALGNCSISNNGSSIEIGATRPGDGRVDAGGSDNGGADDSDDVVAPPPPACTDDLCRGNYSVVVLRPTLADVASFAPASAPFVDEPDGIGIVGMPMNFVVTAGAHEQGGTLFDLPVTVRFTPTSYLFVHGDGTSRETATGGQTWSQLGRAQFSATETSHAYAASGTYTATASVRYAAEANFGNGWMEVPGVLEIAAGSTTLRIVEVRTALVDQTCAENPAGPGC